MNVSITDWSARFLKAEKTGMGISALQVKFGFGCGGCLPNSA